VGADLCGHIMVGPHRLNRAAIKRTEETFLRIQTILKPALEALREKAEVLRTKQEDVTLGMLQQTVGEKKSKELAELLGAPTPTKAYITLWADGACPVLESFERLVSLDIHELLTDFVCMWEGAFHRDRMSRYTPDRRQQIVAVGERTWGSGPEEGSAWWLANQMTDFNLLAPLGIR
jgi:hypothetical protein